jgi:hypothetical protein
VKPRIKVSVASAPAKRLRCTESLNLFRAHARARLACRSSEF